MPSIRHSRALDRLVALSLAITCEILALGASRMAAAQSARWNLYSDAGFFVDDASGEPARFLIGGVDFFVTASYEDIRLVSENVLEILEDGVVFDLERIHLDYLLVDWLGIRIGRSHTPLGYYATAFHHALLFALSAERPQLVSFEDDGGILPAHQVGVAIFGAFDIDEMLFSYDLALGNGRGQFADDVLSTFDRNEFKGITGRVTLELIPDLEIGVSSYFDQIPAGFTDDSGTVVIDEGIRELILGAHVAYRVYPLHLIAEFFQIFHEGKRSGKQTNLTGGFMEAGLQFDRLTPYARAEVIERSSDDLFFNASGAPEELLDVGIGLRYRLHEQAVAKVEGSREFQSKVNRLAVQVAFGF